MTRASLLACAAIVCALVALCPEARPEAAIEVYERPRAVAANGKVFLFAARRGAPHSLAAYARDEETNAWQQVTELRGDYGCAAAIKDRLYLFLTESVVELNASDCKKTDEAPWPFTAWPAQSAVAVGDTLVAFGVADGTLHSAVLPAGKDPLDGRWSYRDVPVEGQGGCVQVRAAVAAGKLWLFWSVKDPDRAAETLWAAELVDGKPTEATKLDALADRAEFAPVAFGGEPAVVYGGLPRRLSAPSFLKFRKHRRDRWLPVERAQAVVNPFDERTLSLSAVATGSTIQMFLDTDYRILETSYSGGHWGPPRAALSDSRVDWVIEHVSLILMVFVAALVVFVISVARSRFLPRRAIIGDIEYAFAPWWRRGGAYVFDLIIALLAAQAIHVLSGRVPTAASWAVAVFVFEFIYFTAFEARSGKTPGKRLFGIVTVSRNGGYPSWGQAALRNLPRVVIDSLSMTLPGAFIGAVAILNTRSSQRFGDLAAGTHVVREHHQK